MPGIADGTPRRGLSQLPHLELLALAQARTPGAGGVHLKLATLSRDALLARLRHDAASQETGTGPEM